MTLFPLVEEISMFVKGVLQDAESGHDWLHIERVLKNAGCIYDDEKKGDLFVIQLAVLLHDIADAKFHDGDENIGPSTARKILMDHHVNKEKIDEVVLIIKNMSYRHSFSDTSYTSIELNIVSDADKLDAMGAIGIARAFNYGGYKNRQIYDPLIYPVDYSTKESYVKNDGPTINHFYEKLLKLKDMMRTPKGKALAMERHLYMLGFLDQFFREVNFDNL